MSRPERTVAEARPAGRVLIAGRASAVDLDALAPFRARGIEVVSCPNSQSLLEAVLRQTPTALVYALRPHSGEDLGVLHLVRRAAPELPIVLLAAEGSLDTRKLVQDLRPVYYGVCPVETLELRDAVGAALARPRVAS